MEKANNFSKIAEIFSQSSRQRPIHIKINQENDKNENEQINCDYNLNRVPMSQSSERNIRSSKETTKLK